MIGVIKKVRQQIAVKRLLRLHESSYSRIRHYWASETGATTANKVRHLPYSRLTSLHNAGEPRISRRFATTAAVSSSTMDQDEDNVRGNMESLEMEEASFERTVDSETDDYLDHLRVKLYEIENEEKIAGYLERLYEAASIQQVFDVVEDQEKADGKINLKVVSQALVTIWDLQKLLFNISANFDPERDFFDRPSFIEKVSTHPVFLEKIVKPVMENCEFLDDEPLLATLLCLKRMNYDMRSPECQKFLEECLRRKETLSLPSMSRLFVCLRDESLYGSIVSASFCPLLSTYVDNMSSDLDVRLVAIALRNANRILSEAMVDKFRTRIEMLVDDLPNWETVTLCKVFLVLIHCNNLGIQSKNIFETLGEALVGRVPNMDLMDVLSLQSYLEKGFLHPYSLVEALVNRMMRIVQEGMSTSSRPRLDLLATVAPYLKSVEQRRQLAVMLQEYLENHDFEFASGILFVILRWSRSNNTKLYDLFWSKAADMVTKKLDDNEVDRRILKLAREYLSFIYGLGFAYRNKWFEFTVKRYLHRLIDNYKQGVQPCIIHPVDFSRALSFLIGCATLNDSLFYELDLVRILDDFVPQFRSADLVVLSRGLESAIINLFYPKKPTEKYYDRILEICSILEEQCSRVLLNSGQMVDFSELLAIYKSALVTRRVKGESPILDLTMQRIIQSEIGDSKGTKDLAQHLLNGWNYYPEATQKIEDFIWNSRNTSISPELIEKFVTLAFCVGWEANTDSDDDSDRDVFGLCGKILTKNWNKLSYLGLLQSSLGLCFYRRMSKELVQNIFSVEFLDQLDGELASSYKSNQYPLRLRTAMMELNRAVCLDMPDVNLPWFHEKFCEELYAMNKIQETYLHKEVRKVLVEVVGDETAIQTNMISPYYYNIDFLIEFDDKGRPIRRNKRSPVGFFRRLRESTNTEPVTVDRKVAVLMLSPASFTKSVRSLKGQLKLRRRHLEILGYDVIEIDPRYWNSMFMSENSVRHNFLETKLYASASAIS